MTQQIILRQETPNDFKKVFELNTLAFGEDNESKLIDALRKNTDVFIPELSIVAINDNKIVGHILFTKINIQDEKGNLNESLALAPMSVKPEWQKKGIGGNLIKHGIETAKNLGYKSIIVLGHEYYYPKFGFKPAENWNIKTSYDVPSNVFMAL